MSTEIDGHDAAARAALRTLVVGESESIEPGGECSLPSRSIGVDRRRIGVRNKAAAAAGFVSVGGPDLDTFF